MAERLPALHIMARDHLAETRALKNDQKGYYLDILLYMHLSPRRGYLLNEAGKVFSHEQLAGMTGTATAEESSRLFKALEDVGLVRMTGDRIPYSPWLVEKERQRQEGKKNGKLGGNPNVLKGRLTPIITPLVNPQLNHPPNPNPEGESEDPGGREEGGVGEEAREELHRAFLEVFNLLPVTQEEVDTYRDFTMVLHLKGAKAADIADRRARYKKAWPNAVCTPFALVHHWDTFAPPPPRATPKPPPPPDELDENDFKTAAEQRAWQRQFFANLFPAHQAARSRK